MKPPHSRLGTYVNRAVGGETVRAFVPPPLPPEPPLALDPDLQTLLERATAAVGRLDGLAALLPDVDLFIYMYVRKEALLSSQIEGTQSSLADLLRFESDQTPLVPLDDVREVSRYVAAMSHGLERLREGFPLSLRLVREIHAVLMSGARGGEKAPGEFRRSQNWIGGTRPGQAAFVPPPPEQVLELMSGLEHFLHDRPVRTPTLIKAALAHVQFETIHPFLDGNGRAGRLLITLLLCAEGLLAQPILYLSLYFKTHRQTYYDLLQRVRLEGAWEAWLGFFLQGVLETAEGAVTASRAILTLFAEDRARIEGLGRASSAALRVHDLLKKKPYLEVPTATIALGFSEPTVAKAVAQLETLGIVQETTGKKRDRVWVYQGYLELLRAGTEPLG